MAKLNLSSGETICSLAHSDSIQLLPDISDFLENLDLCQCKILNHSEDCFLRFLQKVLNSSFDIFLDCLGWVVVITGN